MEFLHYRKIILQKFKNNLIKNNFSCIMYVKMINVEWKLCVCLSVCVIEIFM